MNPKHLYTYLPKDNTAEKDGLLSTALAPHGWEKYRGRADIPIDADKEAVLAGLERMDIGRSRAISVFTEPIGADAPEGVRGFADSHQLYAMPSYKELKAMGLVSDLIRCVRHRKQTIRVNDANYRKVDWSQTAPHENGFGLSGTPHYLMVTTKGKIPAELVKKAGANSDRKRDKLLAAVLRHIKESQDSVKVVVDENRRPESGYYGGKDTIEVSADASPYVYAHEYGHYLATKEPLNSFVRGGTASIGNWLNAMHLYPAGSLFGKWSAQWREADAHRKAIRLLSDLGASAKLLAEYNSDFDRYYDNLTKDPEGYWSGTLYTNRQTKTAHRCL